MPQDDDSNEVLAFWLSQHSGVTVEPTGDRESFRARIREVRLEGVMLEHDYQRNETSGSEKTLFFYPWSSIYRMGAAGAI